MFIAALFISFKAGKHCDVLQKLHMVIHVCHTNCSDKTNELWTPRDIILFRPKEKRPSHREHGGKLKAHY